MNVRYIKKDLWLVLGIFVIVAAMFGGLMYYDQNHNIFEKLGEVVFQNI